MTFTWTRDGDRIVSTCPRCYATAEDSPHESFRGLDPIGLGEEVEYRVYASPVYSEQDALRKC